jgi:hypothetical protein
MSKFTELLNKPLPSANDNYNESSLFDDYDVDDLFEEGCEGATCEDTPETMGTGYSLFGDRNPVTTSDDVATSDTVDDTMGTEEIQTPLTDEQSRNVDDTINAVATPILIQNELNEDEIKEFVESVDSDIAVNEGFLTEKTIVKFDKHAKKAQLYEVAVAAVAREHKDPLFKKLETTYKIERTIKAKLRKKYNAEAQRKVKEYLARAKKSKSGILSRIAAKITGKN